MVFFLALYLNTASCFAQDQTQSSQLKGKRKAGFVSISFFIHKHTTSLENVETNLWHKIDKCFLCHFLKGASVRPSGSQEGSSHRRCQRRLRSTGPVLRLSVPTGGSESSSQQPHEVMHKTGPKRALLSHAGTHAR